MSRLFMHQYQVGDAGPNHWLQAICNQPGFVQTLKVLVKFWRVTGKVKQTEG